MWRESPPEGTAPLSALQRGPEVGLLAPGGGRAGRMYACLGGHCTARGMGRGAGRKGSAPCGRTAEEAQCGKEGLCWNLGRSAAPTAAAMFTPWEGVMTCPGTQRAVISRAGKLGYGGTVGRMSQGDGKQAEASMPVARRRKGNPQIPAVVAHDSTHTPTYENQNMRRLGGEARDP